MLKLPPFDKIGQTPVPDFVNANPSAGIAGSIVNGDIFNAIQDELVNLIVGAGLTPDPNNLAQVLAAVRALIGLAVGEVPNFSATEGVKDVAGVFSLDVSDLPQATPAATDRVPFFQTSSGHHAQDTFADFAAAVLSHLAPDPNFASSVLTILAASPTAAKAWGIFDCTTSPPTIVGSYNVASIVEFQEVGDYTINFATPVPAGTSYTVSGGNNPATYNGLPPYAYIYGPLTQTSIGINSGYIGYGNVGLPYLTFFAL